MKKLSILVILCGISASPLGQDLTDADKEHVRKKVVETCEASEGVDLGKCIERTEALFYGGYARCKSLIPILRDAWLYYDDFKIYAVDYGGGLGVHRSTCTIHAFGPQWKSPKHVRVETEQRVDSSRFRYAPVPVHDRQFEDCRKLLLIDCLRDMANGGKP